LTRFFPIANEIHRAALRKGAAEAQPSQFRKWLTLVQRRFDQKN
jgi:hypothetical protein